MTILIKYPMQNLKSNKEFFAKKEKELTNLDWAKWGGWFDSDGCFTYIEKKHSISCSLSLMDRSPVEIFSKTFEVSFSMTQYATEYDKSVNNIPSEKFTAVISGKKALWFCKKIHPFIINKNNKLNNILNKFNVNLSQNYNNMTKDEFISWLIAFIEGDGCFTCTYKKYPALRITSNNNHLLNYIKDRCAKENIVNFGNVILKQKAGVFKMSSKSNVISTRKNGYILNALKKDNLIPFYNTILPRMILDRKKQIILNHFELFKNYK